MRQSVSRRLTALVLTWVVPATGVWAAAPPAPSAAPPARLAAPAPVSSYAGPLPIPPQPAATGLTAPASIGASLLPLLHGGHDDAAAVRPILECVTQQGPAAYTAYFGYKNENRHAVTIPMGAQNQFTPGPDDRGQPAQFQPGRSPYYPNAAFSVPFALGLLWTLKGPDGRTRAAVAWPHAPRCAVPPPPAPACGITVFGPQRFNRTCGPPDVYTRTFSLPGGAAAPYTLTIRNGEANGSHRVSSASVKVNGLEVAGPSDFGPHVGQIVRSVSLEATNTLRVQLQSAPNSYLTVSICASSGDPDPPVLTFAAPPALTNDATPAVVVRYSDAGSGVDTASLQVFLDDEDRSAAFSRRSDEASAELTPISEGVHQLRALLRDLAGNATEATHEFRVDSTPPALAIAEPTSGAYLSTTTPTVRVTYADTSGIDPTSLAVVVNGVDRTALFARTETEAVAALELAPGPAQVVARVRDLAGNEATAVASVVVDLQAPTLTIAQPAGGAHLGTAEPDVLVQYADDQGLDLATLVATIDGAPATLIAGPDTATGVLGPLADGPHTLAVRLRDRAGHEGTATAAFSVDTALPNLQILYPTPGLITREAAPVVYATYVDALGLDLASLRIRVNGSDRTSDFSAGPDSVTGDLTALADGANTVALEIRDLTGNLAQASVEFVRDTTAPTVSVTQPAAGAAVANAQPAIVIAFADAGTGIESAFTRVFVDGADRTDLFALGAGGATGSLDAPLPDGPHEVRAVVQDRAGNVSEAAAAFVVDTAAPVLALGQPFPGAFLNDPTPDVRVEYADPGSGLDLGSLGVFLRSGDGPEADVTGLLVVGDAEATGALVEPLGEGTHRLRAEIRDRAGNLAAAEAAFEVDTVAPTFVVDEPGSGDYVATPTPTIGFRYADDRSGVELGLLSVLVDGVDRTDRFTIGADAATGTLLPEDALADGEHALAIAVVDRAGNASAPVAHPFFVDTVAPFVTVGQPAAGAYLGDPSVTVGASFADASAAGVFAARVLVDSVDRTAELVVTPTAAQGAFSVGSGAHSVRVEVEDWAGNVSAATASFTLDLEAPVLAIASPADGAVVAASPVELTGTATDADPQLVVTASLGGESVPCAIGFACSVPIAEGPNAVTVTATDRFGRSASATRSLALDTRAPVVAIVSPTAGEYASGDTLVVQGSVSDATATRVVVNGVAAATQGASFTATVPVGVGPQLEVVAVATDAAGNVGQASLSVGVDRTPPQVAITSPANGAYLQGPAVDVAGTVSDTSSVMLDLNGQPADVSGGAFTARLPVVDGPLAIVATARDAANNVSQVTASVTIDSVAPTVAITQPADGTVTQAASLVLEGSVSDTSPVSATLDGALLGLSAGAFSQTLSLSTEGARSVTVQATDAAGNVGARTVTLLVDRTAPSLSVAAPAEGAVLASRPIVVSGTVSDASAVEVSVNGAPAVLSGAAWQASVDAGDGPQTLTITATDAAANAASVSRTVVVDSAPPVLTIAGPAPGSLTRFDQVTVTGTASDASVVTVTLNGAPCTVEAGSFACTAALVEGDNHLLVVATDAAGRQAAAEVDVTRDGTPPVLDVTAPSALSRGRAEPATVTAQDAVGVAEIVLRLNGQPLATCAAASCSATLAVPETASAGDTLTLTAEARDTAGNVTTASRGISVVADGVVVGTVLDDATSLPLAGATVTLVSGQGSVAATTDANGRYSLPAGDTTGVVIVAKAGMTSAERPISIASGVGSVPVDARLTALADPNEAGVRATPLSPQGLPGLLPLGWSPVGAVHVTAATDATFGELPAGLVHLAAYNATLHAWTLLTRDLTPTDGGLAVALPGPGAFALVVPDPDGPALPAPGAVLPEAAMVALPATATSSGQVDPALIPPTGGTARGTLTVASPVALPSGTVVQAEIEETYSLASGQTASTEPRRHDILVYRQADGTLAARFPITPSRTYETADLTSGVVHLDILAGREAVRGKTGGSAPVVVEDGPARLSVPGMAMPEDTAVSVKAEELSGFLPTTGVEALHEVVVDLSGKSLGLGAELSVETSLASASDTLVLAKVERVQGVPYLTVVALGRLAGDRIVSQAYAGLPGIVTEGRYAFFRLAGPVGFVAGTTTASGAPVKALVATDGLPFVGLADAQGRFQVAAAPGSAALEATVAATSLRGSATVEVLAPEPASVPRTVSQDVVLTGTITTATVRPQDGSPAAPTNTPIEIESSAPLNAATATAGNVRLLTADGAIVATRLVLSASRKVLALVPDAALLPSTLYRIEATGLADAFGGLVSVPTTSFTTKADVAPVYDTAKLVFSLPDADGNVSLTAPPGTLAPGTEILVINATSGFVATFTAENDGAVGVVLPASFPATISDKLFVTITDPLGNVTSFTRSQYEDPATGRTAIGPGGGTVKAKDDPGFELRIPEGALDQGVTLKLTGFDLADLPQDQQQLPELGETHFGRGLKLESADKPEFKMEVKLAFPLPAGLDGRSTCTAGAGEPCAKDAFFYVVRKLDDGQGRVAFETLDEANVEGDGASAMVVTASWPLAGYSNSFSAFGLAGGVFSLQAAASSNAYLMWRYDQSLPGRPIVGSITGKVVRSQRNADGSETLVGIKGALVTACDAGGHPLLVRGPDAGHPNVALSQKDGTFTLWDPSYTGGTVKVVAALSPADLNQGCQSVSADPNIKTATAYEVDPLDSKTPPLLRRYRNVATVNLVFDPEAEPPAKPAIAIDIKTILNGQRVDIDGGIVTEGTHVILVLTAENAEVRNVTLNGASCVTTAEGPHVASVDLDSDPACHIASPGTYNVTARALSPALEVKDAARSFRVVAPGGNNTEPVAGPPAVVSFSPRANATGVPITVFPQLVFSEPVVIADAVSLRETAAGQDVPLTLLGVTRAGDVIDLRQNPTVPVTSLTLQPLSGLRYSTDYEIVLGSGIVDLDAPTPGELLAQSSGFTTFVPEVLPEQPDRERFGSPGIYLFQDRAYLVENNFSFGDVRVFDVSDPVEPREIDPSPQARVFGRPVDVAGEDGTLVVVTGSTNKALPWNVLVFDINTRTQTTWMGAASAITSTTSSGHITRIQVKGDKVFTATSKKGIQVVDLARARANFVPPPEPGVYSPAYADMLRLLKTEGQGFGNDAVEQETLVLRADGKPAYLRDLKVIDLAFSGDTHRAAVAVAGADLPFVLVDTETSTAYPKTLGDGMAIAKGEAVLTSGGLIAAGTLQNKPSAAVVGTGRTTAGAPLGFALATLDLSNPTSPAVLAIVDLPAQPGLSLEDAILHGEILLIGMQSADQSTGKVLIVNLANASHPIFAGEIEGVGGRLALGENNILFSTARSVFGGDSDLGGVKTTTLGPILLLLDKAKKVLPRIKLPKNTDTYVQGFGLVGGDTIDGVEASIIENDGTVRSQTGTIPTTTTVTLTRDPDTGHYLAPLKIVDKDCALELEYSETTDEQLIKTSCKDPADDTPYLESGPWTKLKIKLPQAYGGLERIADIHAFRLVAIGDSLTQGVQSVTVTHQDQRYSYPAQLAEQINNVFRAQYGQQVRFVQPMINEPGIGTPKLGPTHGEGPGKVNGFPVPGRLNAARQPVNNLACSGARVVDLNTSKKDDWGDANTAKEVNDPGAPKSVWPFTLQDKGTQVDQAVALDPSLLIVFIGNNDALNAAMSSKLSQLTPLDAFTARYDDLIAAVKARTRAQVIVGTVPSVDAIPQLANVGGRIGPVPFRIVAPRLLGQEVLDEESLTRDIEKALLSPEDPRGRCHGARLPDGTCDPHTGAKISLQGIYGGLWQRVRRTFGQAQPFLAIRKALGNAAIHLSEREVLRADQLQTIRDRIVGFDDHIKATAVENSFAVMDLYGIFQQRSTNLDDPTKLNSLFTGTPRLVGFDFEAFNRGRGNSLLSWDGVHPNSAGYALAANEALRVVGQKLASGDFGGIEKNTFIAPIKADTITYLLKAKYLALARTRVFGWDDPNVLGTVE